LFLVLFLHISFVSDFITDHAAPIAFPLALYSHVTFVLFAMLQSLGTSRLLCWGADGKEFVYTLPRWRCQQAAKIACWL